MGFPNFMRAIDGTHIPIICHQKEHVSMSIQKVTIHSFFKA